MVTGRSDQRGRTLRGGGEGPPGKWVVEIWLHKPGLMSSAEPSGDRPTRSRVRDLESAGGVKPTPQAIYKGLGVLLFQQQYLSSVKFHLKRNIPDSPDGVFPPVSAGQIFTLAEFRCIPATAGQTVASAKRWPNLNSAYPRYCGARPRLRQELSSDNS